MLACEAQKIDVAKLLIAGFPRCVPWANKFGMDAVCLPSSTYILSSKLNSARITANALLPQRHPPPTASPPNNKPTLLANSPRQRWKHRPTLRKCIRRTQSPPPPITIRRIANGPKRILLDAHRIQRHRRSRSLLKTARSRIRKAEGRSPKRAAGEGDEEGGWR